MLQWSLSIATRDRPEYLYRCVKCALLQTLPPKDIVVVESGRNHKDSELAVRRAFSETGKDVCLTFEVSPIQSISVQRNRAIDLSLGDIVFVIDDDSYMAIECAERVMAIYELDLDCQIAGLMPLLSGVNFFSGVKQGLPDQNSESFTKKLSRIAASLKDSFKGEIIAPWIINNSSTVMASSRKNIVPTNVLHGCRMTFRKSIVSKYRFDENITAVHEETELCARIARDYSLVQLLDPLIFHDEATFHFVGRNSGAYRTKFILGQAYLNLKLSEDREKAYKYVCRYARRTIIIDAILGLLHRDLSKMRGAIKGYRGIHIFKNLFDADLSRAYRDLWSKA